MRRGDASRANKRKAARKLRSGAERLVSGKDFVGLRFLGNKSGTKAVIIVNDLGKTGQRERAEKLCGT